MSTKSREVIYGGRIMGAQIRAEGARGAAQKAIREADRAEAEAWSIRMEGYGGPAQPSPTIAQCLNGGLSWLEVECNCCKTRASLPLNAIRRPRDTPIWKLEAALKCRSCRKGRHAPPVHMVKLTAEREITQYQWVHPDDDRYSRASFRPLHKEFSCPKLACGPERLVRPRDFYRPSLRSTRLRLSPTFFTAFLTAALDLRVFFASY